MKFYRNIYGSQRTNSDDFSDPWLFIQRHLQFKIGPCVVTLRGFFKLILIQKYLMK